MSDWNISRLVKDYVYQPGSPRDYQLHMMTNSLTYSIAPCKSAKKKDLQLLTRFLIF